MQLNLVTNQILEVNNMRAIVTSIDPEAPSLITNINIQYTEGPFEGQSHRIRLFNQ